MATSGVSAAKEDDAKKPAKKAVVGESRGSDKRHSYGDPRRDIEWVYQNISEKGVKRKDAPSGGAWGLLLWAKENKAHRAEFYRNIYPKILPTKSQLDDIYERRNDDGAKLDALIAKLLDAKKRSEGGDSADHS